MDVKMNEKLGTMMFIIGILAPMIFLLICILNINFYGENLITFLNHCFLSAIIFFVFLVGGLSLGMSKPDKVKSQLNL